MSSKKLETKYPLCENRTVDVLIVGAGLAGLHSALQLSKKHPHAKILVAEAYNYTGGRVLTYEPKAGLGKSKALPKSIQWEMGAGRIHQSHHKILSYISKYHLTTLPISEVQQFIPKATKKPQADPWPQTASAINTLLHTLKPEILATNTIDTLLEKIVGNSEQALLTFPYYAETHVLRADAALRSFEKEMGTYTGYVAVKEGLSAMIDGLVEELKEKGVEFLFEHKLVELNAARCIATFANGCTVNYKECILALHAKALKQITLSLSASADKHSSASVPSTLALTQKLPALQHVIMCPLLRIYAVFETKKGQSWFSDVPKTVTDSPLRYIIPINPAKGVIMISYTDASNTQIWNTILEKKGLSALQAEIMKQVRALFPDRHIPDPLYLKPHPWTEGCSYWAPGLYDIHTMSQSVIHPFPHIYICNESFSEHHQCWMEGAIDHADEMLKHFPKDLSE